jgi:hypothetical protein
MLKNSILSLVSLSLLTACAVESSRYAARGRPQSLIDASSERVNFSLAEEKTLDDLKSWINNDQPTRATLNCSGQHPNCEQAELVLHQFGVPYDIKPASITAGNEVVLYYERLVTNECDNRFVDNHINPFNLNHENFGCSVATNVVQMVGDQRQFVSPAYQDPKDAEGAVKAFDDYLSSGR